MRIYNKDIKRARRWLASGRSIKVIRYLEPKVPLFLEDPDFYAILGRACLSAGLLKDADTYLSRGIQADPAHFEVRLTLAVNHLKRKDPASAVRTWLEVLEDCPDNPSAKRGLRTLKRISDQDGQDRFLDRFDPGRFLPDISVKWPRRVFLSLLIALTALTLVYFREPLILGIARRLSPLPTRIGSEGLLSVTGGDLTEGGLDVLYPMTEGEVSRTLKKAIRHFEAYQDNSARHELNKVRHSNAGEEIRRQATLLLESLRESDIETIETDFTLAQVTESPWLYEGCWVLWRGVTANVIYDDEAIKFDFLVGYQDGTVLEGRIPVEVPFLAVMEPLPLELLARVELSGDEFILVGKTLHFLR